MKMVAGILYHIFPHLCPKIALLTLKFLELDHPSTNPSTLVRTSSGQAQRCRDPASLILSYFPAPALVSLSQITSEGRQVHQDGVMSCCLRSGCFCETSAGEKGIIMKQMIIVCFIIYG
jgi:hypothetical protein